MNIYKKPKLRVNKVKMLNLFYQNRFLDSINLIDYNTDKDFIAHTVEGCGSGGSGGCVCSGCFPPTTKITTVDGTTKMIKDIKKGDSILSYDLYRNKTTIEKVIDLLVHNDNRDGYYVINDILKATGNHPLWVNSRMWSRVENLKISDNLINQQGEKIVVKSIKKIKRSKTVYNLHLKGKNHNYFADGILVHNAQVK